MLKVRPAEPGDAGLVFAAHRGRGIGKALPANLARRCIDEKLTRLQWWVPDWNQPSIDFYRPIGA